MPPATPSGPPPEPVPSAFTAPVPTAAPAPDPVGPAGTVAPAAIAAPPWHAGLRPATGEVARSVRLATRLFLVGIPVGIAWWAVAPRRAYEVSADGAFAVVSESEAAVGSDGWLLLMLMAVGVLAGVYAWWVIRPRGPLVTVGLAVGMVGCGALAWFIGSLLGRGPTADQLADVGSTVLGPLELGAAGVLVMGPFVAVAAYALGVCFARRDDLG